MVLESGYHVIGLKTPSLWVARSPWLINFQSYIYFNLQCVRELCGAHKENMPTLLKFTVFNELSNARSTNNMAILQVMFNYDKELAPASLAEVYLELMMQKECYLRALRALLREIVRYLRYDINLHSFCLHLMQLSVSFSCFSFFISSLFECPVVTSWAGFFTLC